MSIQALPQTAVRTIRSGQALTDPASVVKELIDNALDARATNITVEISSNTLDVIQVKDNGHGIAPTDRSLVAKPYCTSKLKDETELAFVGGSYLGFRGEALSSALEMSGEMIITTRVEGESIATALKVPHNGEATQDRAAHPPGTTVRIANFLKNQPVRKQVAVKGATKTLNKIKQLLQAYAFARPATRLSLRVIKAKNDRDNWTYAPKVGSGIEDTALKVVGKPCASQCAWAELESEGFVLQAYLPKSDAHASKISGLGQYVSVNGRPLTSARGVSRQLIKIYKEGLRNSPSLEDAKDPFLYLSISCPPGSYDANIEPAKDDVLFGDVDKVVEAVRRLMVISYPEKENPVEVANESDSQEHSFIPLRPSESDVAYADEPFVASGSRPKRDGMELKNNMYDLDEDDLTLLMDSMDQPVKTGTKEVEEEPPSTNSAATSNPWIMAKMNSLYNRKTDVNIQLMTPAKQASSNTPEESSPVFEPQSAPQVPAGLPTPRASSPLFHPADESVLRRSIGASNLPPPVSHLSSQSVSPVRHSVESMQETPVPNRISLPPQQDLQGTPLNMIPEATPRRRSPPKQNQRQYVNKPFVPPIDPERDAWFHFPEEERTKQFPRKGRSQRYSEGLVPSGEPYSQPRTLTPPSNNTDIREFLGRGRAQQAPTPAVTETPTEEVENVSPVESHRNTTGPKGFVLASELNLESTQFAEPSQPPARPAHKTTVGSKGFVPASELDLESTQFAEPAPRQPTRPTRRRRTTDTRPLREIPGNGAINSDGDSEYEERPRRKRTGESEPKRVGRIKSSTPSLEKVPLDAQVQNVIARTSMTIDGIQDGLQKVRAEGTFAAWNAPTVNNESNAVKDAVEEDVQRWTASLGRLLQKREPEAELVRDFIDVVRSAAGRWGSYAAAA